MSLEASTGCGGGRRARLVARYAEFAAENHTVPLFGLRYCLVEARSGDGDAGLTATPSSLRRSRRGRTLGISPAPTAEDQPTEREAETERTEGERPDRGRFAKP